MFRCVKSCALLCLSLCIVKHFIMAPKRSATASGAVPKCKRKMLTIAEKISLQNITVPKWLPFSKMNQVDYYSTYTKNCTAHFSDKEITNIRAYYYAMCVETDAMLGEILSALYDTNLLNETILIFTSDHGELALEHRQFYKMSMYEGSSHIPFLIMGPNVKAGQQISNPISLVDVYPTVLDIAEIACPCNLSGYSLLPFLTREYQARNNLHPEWVLSEFHGSDANASTYMIRTSSWKLIAYADGSSVPSQLFGGPEEGLCLLQTARGRPISLCWGPRVQGLEAQPCRDPWPPPGGAPMPEYPVWDGKCWGEDDRGHPDGFRVRSRHFRHTGVWPGLIAGKQLEPIRVPI
ncbi:ARSK Arylsulfatase, partial [Polypterus senegalus]